MKITIGQGTTEFGPGISIDLAGDEVACAIDAYVKLQGISVTGARTVTVNGELCREGRISVDPCGAVSLSGRGAMSVGGGGGGGGSGGGSNKPAVGYPGSRYTTL